MDYQSLMNLLDQLHAPIQDVQLICEGEIEILDTDGSRVLESQHSGRFQASYAFRRADGAAYLDLYFKPHHSDVEVEHEVAVFFQGTQTSHRDSTVVPTNLVNTPRTRPSGPGSMQFTGSPERFLSFGDLAELKLRGPNAFQFEGWEEINGSRCARVSMGSGAPSDRAKGFLNTFWFDLERGGHYVQAEVALDGEKFLSRTGIVLEQLPTHDGQKVWFPVKAVVESFMHEGKARSTPASREVYRVVQSSVVINRGLDDSMFDFKLARSRSSGGQALDLAKQFEEAPRKKLDIRTDPESVESDLIRRIDEAESQAVALESESPALRAQRRNLWIQGVLVCLGILAIFVAIYARRTRPS